MKSSSHIRIETKDDLRYFNDKKSVFLSVSVPYNRYYNGGKSKDLDKKIKKNKRYLKLARPDQVRSSILALTRTMIKNNYRIIFGAHPAISPMVLSAAKDLKAKPNSILIFQSAFFSERLPISTLNLASWDAGQLILTPKLDTRDLSLTLMRKLMVSMLDIKSTIVVGGMDGVEEEVSLFKENNPEKPIYTIASTGSAAQLLWESDPEAYCGNLRSPEDLLLNNFSYSIVSMEILNDINSQESESNQAV